MSVFSTSQFTSLLVVGWNCSCVTNLRTVFVNFRSRLPFFLLPLTVYSRCLSPRLFSAYSYGHLLTTNGCRPQPLKILPTLPSNNVYKRWAIKSGGTHVHEHLANNRQKFLYVCTSTSLKGRRDRLRLSPWMLKSKMRAASSHHCLERHQYCCPDIEITECHSRKWAFGFFLYSGISYHHPRLLPT